MGHLQRRSVRDGGADGWSWLSGLTFSAALALMSGPCVVSGSEP